ncbi:ABC transporter permease [Edaphobacter dinghuensis]|uniref:Glycosyl transferase family 1 n=1 Tax=Edaphobacter dinghuensis TaxID=1560005 RepID=A0A917HN00_9BACT|nr:FtsX-like permease family protein [Edaphobacter dinghuensis]GGG84777.1 glycosyl transferase family 1 [Edaphobacter dinghuensis]
MAGLSYRSAIRIAAREMRSSRGKFFFVILSVAIGVAALTGVRGFSSSFRATLLTRARSIMAADVSARMFEQSTPEQQKGLDAIAAEGVETTPVTELLSMASSPKTLDPLLVSLKAVDPAMYPFYGTVELAPAAALKSVLTANSVVVADDLLVRLHMKVGDDLKIGNKLFRIASVVVNEPDRLSGNFAAGPRVLISREGLDASGLLAPGSHAGQRFLFKLPAPRDGSAMPDAKVAALRDRLEKLLPESRVIDYRETNPALTQGLDRATNLLSLMSLVALILGAIGVGMAMRTHLQQRLDTIAIMKSLGASSGQIMKIYLLQTLLLGLLGGVIGVALGVGVQMAFPHLLAGLLHMQTEIHVQGRTVLTGLGVGMLTTLLFTLPPLLDIRGVRPVLILRRAVEESDDPFVTAVFRKLRKNGVQVGAAILILAGLAAIAATLTDSAMVGGVFSLGLVSVLAVLLAASALVLAGLKRLLKGTRLRLPSAVRHGLANLYRPGNPSAALLAALGLGVMQIMTVYFVQQAVVRELHISSAPNLPNVFLVDITPSEIDGVRSLLKAQPSVTAPAEMMPVVSSRIIEIDGVAVSQAKLKNFPKRMLQSISLTWATAPPPGTSVTAGKWWQAAERSPVVAVNERDAERLGVKVGSHLTFAAQDSRFVATVVALTKADGQHAYSRASFFLPPPVLAGLPAVWYGGVHADPARVGELQRALYKSYPTVTVINVAQALETVRSVVIQITYVIQFLAAFSIFAGIVILASSIAGTRYRRIREVVVLKTLGATRGRIATIFSIEFAVLGLVAGIVGITCANLIARVLLHRMQIVFHWQWGWSAVALVGTAALTVATGWMASHRILGQKPLEVLREE